jgi:hypothetical protein
MIVSLLTACALPLALAAMTNAAQPPQTALVNLIMILLLMAYSAETAGRR